MTHNIRQLPEHYRPATVGRRKRPPGGAYHHACAGDL